MAVGSFLQNLENLLKPTPREDHTFVISTSMKPETSLPRVDARDAGVVVAEMLREPEEYWGRIVYAAAELRTMKDLVGIVGTGSGRDVRYEQMPEADSKDFLKGMTLVLAEDFGQTVAYYQEYGHFGQETADWTQPAMEGKLGRLTRVAEFVNDLEFRTYHYCDRQSTPSMQPAKRLYIETQLTLSTHNDPNHFPDKPEPLSCARRVSLTSPRPYRAAP
ncbi:hypothetical protein CLAFUW4_05183 [Fulvia fulva]|uniref:NmrA-like domain-containing protein n=1 Tax=Passalora fulva TaxID=5499 RepID=A0A9Q8UUA2_PASFU|nr:uncharacterized protein CLAFUR5_11723 [Fulvia fulva]KAK4627199.1 hypothetical protein CLAFUR4_05169 [Fulvia fulva]KAK4627549.1 hypothetical protein CLAFUR0_05175 [Fulvia fulva]UJO22721.1 hypothetical protein CLAFUR5_11723 [Fulvia fulva]WPV13957.1 hypothetical protein CLAFUW4_05183 [Fulvia fulva]WPV28270.1 hypothetical protein CLAFUW7_05179 [Fulvia fulva]